MQKKYLSGLTAGLDKLVDEEVNEVIDKAFESGKMFSIQELKSMGARFKGAYINHMLEEDEEV